MADKVEYVQCELVQPDNPEGEKRQIAFIPSNLAEQGRVLKIRKNIRDWDDGWVVQQVFHNSRTIPPDMIAAGQRRFKKVLK